MILRILFAANVKALLCEDSSWNLFISVFKLLYAVNKLFAAFLVRRKYKWF